MARVHSKQAWAKLRAAYRRGEGSIAELAPMFGIPARTAERRCTKEKWVVERVEVAEKAREKAAERDVESVAAMLGKHRGLANLSLRLADLRLKKLEELATSDPFAVSGEDLDDLTKVVARMVPVERLAAGIDRIKPVKPVEVADGDEIVFEIDAPKEGEGGDEEDDVTPPKKAAS